ncbi:MAG: replicative DNA helicase [Verrucomicrobia bacterium]|nr:MAG: replicative DNA helicase [Verrucomicrobiota bacterium]
MTWDAGRPVVVHSVPAPTISNVEAEAALCGAVMMDNKLIDRAAEAVHPADFAEPMLGRIFAAIMQLHGSGQDANPVTLKPYFDEDPTLHDLGGVGFLAQLTGNGAAVMGALDFARQIGELAARRRLAEQLFHCSRLCEDFNNNMDSIAGLVEGAIADTLASEGGSQAMSAADAVKANLDQQFTGAPPGVVSGIIPSLDKAQGPLSPGDLAILASRPGMGKTATALSYAQGVAAQGEGVTIASLEMRAAQLGGRLACSMLHGTAGQMPYSAISANRCTAEQRRELARTVFKLKEMPLWIEDLPSATVGRLGAIVRKHKRRLAARGKVLRLVIVDYLQLLQPDRPQKSLYESISMVSRSLKSLAKSEDVAVLALCQLSRDVERRGDHRPTLSDLRDSGQIEQDADSITFLLRPEEYLKREDHQPGSDKWASWQEQMALERGRIQFIVAKRRAGETGVGIGQWHGEYQAVRG